MSLQVNPDALRAWSKWLDGLAGDIGGLRDGVNAPSEDTDPFPGVDLASAIQSARDQVTGGLAFLASRQTEMSGIAKGVGDKYEITDDDLAAKLRAMGGLQ
ncbi:MAG: hypothetical protein J2P18_01405 [Nocardia sp.]|nr:hypothetical protein [Nocardia sp.]